ncbi:hypothetical protein [Paenibacillus aceris]|uniref:Uncharacterized protein n=1 Tax=Paenibacillus aceris TaxID=869555 RepID=A0ABS4HZL7_9BACL|nr:hypothetical protein [Paenibacillus aceris]MBP1964094.1 hypothetical protein [Paenibacillus aceris]NHW36433.1 hypothetical protein [Paenibacillus aceris]
MAAKINPGFVAFIASGFASGFALTVAGTAINVSNAAPIIYFNALFALIIVKNLQRLNLLSGFIIQHVEFIFRETRLGNVREKIGKQLGRFSGIDTMEY